MAKKLFSDSESSVVYTGFSGIDRASPKSEMEKCTDLVNFRVLSDNSIEKRPGYRRMFSLDAPVRAVWSGVHDEMRTCLVLAGNCLYRLDPDDGRVLGSYVTAESEGAADFFSFDGRLYLLDGAELYEYTAGNPMLLIRDAYIPLYGKDWDPELMGEVNEPMNLITNRIIIRYDFNARNYPIDFYQATLPNFVEKVESMRLDGKPYTADMAFSSAEHILYCNDFSRASYAEVVARVYSYVNPRGALTACRRAVEFDSDGKSRVLLFDGDDESRVYCSAYVSDEMYNYSHDINYFSNRLYFPLDEGCYVGSGSPSVVAACAYSDKVLAFCDGETWQLDVTDDALGKVHGSLVNSSYGASSMGGVTVCENSPYTIGRTGVFKWSERDINKNECDADKVSHPVSKMLPESFYRSGQICAYLEQNELWLLSPDEEDSLFIYNYGKDVWYRFTGIRAELLFTYFGKMCFARGGDIFIFDEACFYDDDIGGAREIRARIESKYLDFGSAEKRKRLYCATLECEGDIKSKGATVKICGVGSVSVFDYTKNTDMSAPETLSDNERTLVIDQAKGFNFQIDDIDRAQATPKLMGEAMRVAANALANTADKYVYSLYEGAGETVSSDDVTVDNIVDLIIDARTKLYANNVSDARDIAVEVSPEIAALILKAKVNLATDNADSLENGLLGTIGGCKIFVSNNIVSEKDGDNVTFKCLARTTRAIAFAEQLSEIDAYRPEKRFADAVKGLHLYGAKVVYPSEMVLLDLTVKA